MAAFYYGRTKASAIYFGKTLIYKHEKRPFIDVYITCPDYLINDLFKPQSISVEHTDGTVYLLEETYFASIDETKYYASLPSDSTYTFLPNQRFRDVEESYNSIYELYGGFTVGTDNITINPQFIHYSGINVHFTEDSEIDGIAITANGYDIDKNNTYTECDFSNRNIVFTFTQDPDWSDCRHDITINWDENTVNLSLDSSTDYMEYTCKNVIDEEGWPCSVSITITSTIIEPEEPEEPDTYDEVTLFIIPQTHLLNDTVYITDHNGNIYKASRGDATSDIYTVIVPTGQNYSFTMEDSDGEVHPYRISAESGYGYALIGDIEYSDTELEANIYPTISDAAYGTLIINQTGEDIYLGLPCAGAGESFYEVNAIPLDDCDNLFFEINPDNLNPNYTYAVAFGGGVPEELSTTDQTYIGLPIDINSFAPNGYCELDVEVIAEVPEYDTTIPELIAIDENTPIAIMDSGGTTRTMSLGEIAEQLVEFNGSFVDNANTYTETMTYWERDNGFVYFWPVGDKSLEEATTYVLTLPSETEVSTGDGIRHIVATTYRFIYRPGTQGHIESAHDIDSMNVHVEKVYVLEED